MDIDLQRFKTKDITSCFYEICYGGSTVIVHNYNSTQYFNASLLCTDDGREFYRWLEDRRSQYLLENVFKNLNSGKTMKVIETENYGKPVSGRTRVNEVKLFLYNGVVPSLRGTYIHNCLLPIILMWKDENLALQLSKTINAYFLEKHDNTQ